MDRNDLLQMLDLDATDRPGTPVDGIAIAEPETRKAEASGNRTALAVDDWGLRRGRELLAESARLAELRLDDAAMADFHTAGFNPEPELLDGCTDRTRHEFIKQMLDTPEYRSLHAGTMLDDTAAAIAATAFAEEFAALRNERDLAKEKDTDALAREMSALRAVGKALASAHDEVEALKEAAIALGLGPGAPGSNDSRAVAAMYRRVRDDPGLRRICELAGRYRRVAQSRQRRKTSHGLDDLVGVELGGDLGRLLPSELARLALPEFELDALRRIVERQAQCRDYRGNEPVAKGPIIVSVDESGSMEGDKIHTAKALALALAWIARQQRRWIALVAYSGDSGERLLALPPRRWNESALMDWLCEFIGRGSTLDVPVREMPKYYEQLRAPVGATDVLFLTDAQCRIPSDVRDSFNAWKLGVQARLISLVIGSSPGDLATVSDEVYEVASLGADESAVGRVLSV
jgi:uncharacterized protein with von Willebrand factor type A (vWA) domain